MPDTEQRLRDLPFFADLPGPALATLAAGAEEVVLPAGAPVMEQNDEALGVFFLLEGALEVLLHHEGVGELFMGSFRDRGSVFGWSALRPPHRCTDSVRCELPTRLLRVARSSFERVVAEDPATGYLLLHRTVAEVDRQLDATRGLLAHDAVETPVPGEPEDPEESW